MKARTRRLITLLLLVVASGAFLSIARAQELGETPVEAAAPEQPQPSKTASISRAVMCEKVENLSPIRQAIAFPVSIGQVYCFTSFDSVPQPMVVYHRWFHHDELSTQTRLRLYPPKWATYSVIQLRETDKGPWRVEVSDQNGRVFDVLRFSITD